MATKSQTAETVDNGQATIRDVQHVLSTQYREAFDAQTPLLQSWDDKESMLISKLNDSSSPNFKSRVTDSRLSTIVFDRAGRVMSQLPSGSVHALTKADLGKSALMNLVLNKYIQPNANAQFPHLTKMRMWDLYSLVYGVQPMLYDYSITDHYIGPDCWLVPIRNWFPQPGKLSVEDSDYQFIENMVSVSWLEDKQGGSWNNENINFVITEAKKGGKSKSQLEFRKRTVTERQREWNTPGGKGPAAQVRLVTKYEAGPNGHWITFCPDFDNKIIRDIANPHKNGRIPIVLKHCFPLIDSIYGLGDFERGKTLQFAMDSLINLYLDGVKMSIFPPLMINTENVVASSIKYQPGGKWLVKAPDAVKHFEGNPQGMQTFNSTYQFLVGALQAQNGTTDTSVAKADEGDPTLGKTPQALAMMKERESARDSWDRYMMETSMQNLYERMINLVSTNQEKPINLHIFDGEIKDLREAGLEDVMEVFDSGKAGKITITKNGGKGKNGKYGLGGCEYCYQIDIGSTMESDQTVEHQNLKELIEIYMKDPMLGYQLQQDGKKFNLGNTFERYVQTSGVPDADLIISDIDQKQVQEAEQSQQQNQMFPSKQLRENVQFDKLPLWAQVQLAPYIGVQVPPAVAAQVQLQLAQLGQAVQAGNANPDEGPSATDQLKSQAEQTKAQAAIQTAKMNLERAQVQATADLAKTKADTFRSVTQSHRDAAVAAGQAAQAQPDQPPIIANTPAPVAGPVPEFAGATPGGAPMPKSPMQTLAASQDPAVRELAAAILSQHQGE